MFVQIADALAIHAAIEEKHFYPAVNKRPTMDILLDSVEEHLEIKRLIADLLTTDARTRISTRSWWSSRVTSSITSGRKRTSSSPG